MFCLVKMTFITLSEVEKSAMGVDILPYWFRKCARVLAPVKQLLWFMFCTTLLECLKTILTLHAYLLIIPVPLTLLTTSSLFTKLLSLMLCDGTLIFYPVIIGQYHQKENCHIGCPLLRALSRALALALFIHNFCTRLKK
jgi:hypothetical protein